jgi:hypothetical protein
VQNGWVTRNDTKVFWYLLSIEQLVSMSMTACLLWDMLQVESLFWSCFKCFIHSVTTIIFSNILEEGPGMTRIFIELNLVPYLCITSRTILITEVYLKLKPKPKEERMVENRPVSLLNAASSTAQQGQLLPMMRKLPRCWRSPFKGSGIGTIT